MEELNEAKTKLEEKTDEVVQEKPKYKFFCAKHGDVTDSVLIITLADREAALKYKEALESFNNEVDLEDLKRKAESPIQYLYCLYDINEAVLNLQEKGILNKIEIVEEKPSEE